MKSLMMTKIVPGNRVLAYTNMGWTVRGVNNVIPESGRNYLMMRIMETQDDTKDMELVTKSPTNVQTGVLKRPLGLYDNTPIHEAVVLTPRDCTAQYDLPASSLRRIQAQSNLFQLLKVPTVTKEHGSHTFVLRMFANFDRPSDLQQYLGWASGIVSGSSKKIDFWWDTHNDVIMSFDKNFMVHLEGVLKASFRQLDSVHF